MRKFFGLLFVFGLILDFQVVLADPPTDFGEAVDLLDRAQSDYIQASEGLAKLERQRRAAQHVLELYGRESSIKQVADAKKFLMLYDSKKLAAGADLAKATRELSEAKKIVETFKQIEKSADVIRKTAPPASAVDEVLEGAAQGTRRASLISRFGTCIKFVGGVCEIIAPPLLLYELIKAHRPGGTVENYARYRQRQEAEYQRALQRERDRKNARMRMIEEVPGGGYLLHNK